MVLVTIRTMYLKKEEEKTHRKSTNNCLQTRNTFSIDANEYFKLTN